MSENEIVSPSPSPKNASTSFMFVLSFVNITSIQIVQDKYCLSNLQLPEEICKDIQHNDNFYQQAIQIYQISSTFMGYKSCIFFIPGIFVSLFLGRWLDKNPQHCRYIFAGPFFGMFFVNLLHAILTFYMDTDYHYLLLASIPFGLFGGVAAFFSVTYSYVAKNSSPESRVICFGLLEFSVLMGGTPSHSLGGILLESQPWFFDNLRNYFGVFLIATCLSFCMAWSALYTIDHDNDSEKEKQKSSASSQSAVNQEETDEMLNTTNSANSSQETSTLQDIFSLNSVLETFKKVLIKRKHNAHLRLWLLMPSIILSLIIILGEMTVAFQFAENTYAWSAIYFSNVKTITSLFYAIGVLVLPYILEKHYKLHETTLAIIGILSLIFACIVRGGFPVPLAFYISEAIHTFSGLCAPATRSLISKIVKEDEISQIYASMASLESIAPIISSLMFTFIFNQTIESYPGFVFHLMALMMFYPLLVLCYIGVCGLKDKPKKDDHHIHKSQESLTQK